MFRSNKSCFPGNPLFHASLDKVFNDFSQAYKLSEKETEIALQANSAHLLDQLFQSAYRCIDSKSRIAMQRVCNDSRYDSIVDEKLLYLNLQQSHDFELLKALPIFSGDNKTTIKYNSAIFLGSQFLAVIADEAFLQRACDQTISSFLIVETSIQSLVKTFCSVDIALIRQKLVDRGIILDFIYEESLEICMHLVYKKVVEMPHYMFGSYVISDGDLDSRLLVLRSWIFKPQGLTSRFVSAYGYTTDEINQTIDAFSNYLGSDRVVLQHLNPNNYPVAIIASGPSLNKSLPALVQNQDKLFIVAAGSSIGPLVNANVRIDLNVILERGEDTAKDYLPILRQYPHIADIPCFRSSTSAPVFANIFKRNIFFHRPLSAAFALTLDEEYGTLPICGPESVNAAFDLVLALGFRKVYLIGADFSAPSLDNHRCEAAIGVSPRALDIVELSNMGHSVFTDKTLISTRDALSSTVSLYQSSDAPVSLFRIGEGLLLTGETLTDSSALASLQGINSKQAIIDQLLRDMKSAPADHSRIDIVLDKLPGQFNSYLANLESLLLASSWSKSDKLEISNLLSSYPRSLFDGDILFEDSIVDLLVTRLLRQVSLFMLAIGGDQDWDSDLKSEQYASSIRLTMSTLNALVRCMCDDISLKSLSLYKPS
jgi:hypothetical protein